MYQKTYEDKDVDKFLQLNFKKTARETTANYFAHPSHDGDKIFEELKEQFSETVLIKEKDFLPLKDYELAFYGDGRVVTFKQSSSHDTDVRFRGNSALNFLYKREGSNSRRIVSPYIYIYMDKDKYNGKEEDIELEMIK